MQKISSDGLAQPPKIVQSTIVYTSFSTILRSRDWRHESRIKIKADLCKLPTWHALGCFRHARAKSLISRQQTTRNSVVARNSQWCLPINCAQFTSLQVDSYTVRLDSMPEAYKIKAPMQTSTLHCYQQGRMQSKLALHGHASTQKCSVVFPCQSRCVHGREGCTLTLPWFVQVRQQSRPGWRKSATVRPTVKCMSLSLCF